MFYFLYKMPEEIRDDQIEEMERWATPGFILKIDGAYCFIRSKK